MNELFTKVLLWALEPQNLTLIVGAVTSLPIIIKTAIKAKEIHTFDEAIEIAKEVTLELSKEKLSNENKNKMAVDFIIKQVPQIKQYANIEKIGDIANMAYHSYVKNKEVK